MSIPMSKYVAITSAVAQTAAASRKDLILRVFTTNPLFAANTVYEFTSSADVGSFAGSGSKEAFIASSYFGWVSKTATKAKKISFMRYSFEALAPFMYSTKALTPLESLKAVKDGSMIVNMGGTAFTVSHVDLSGAESYADVASTIQSALQGNTGGGALWTAATVSYNAEDSSFRLTGGETGENSVEYAEAGESGVDLSALLGWDVASSPVLSAGTKTQTISDILNKTIDLSTNFLTFGFISPTDAYTNLDAIGAWVNEQNMQYRFTFDLGASNYAEGIAIATKYKGMTAQYNINYGNESVVPAWLMSAVLPATTNYNRTNGVKSYMFQQFDSQPVAVGDDDGSLYQTLDNLCINYNGQTQKSGQKIAFYQNGFNADGTDTAVYDNEAWLKDAMATSFLNSFIGLDFISADSDGLAILNADINDIAQEGLNNHVISKGRPLETSEKAYVIQTMGDENAPLDLANNGYVFSLDIQTQTEGAATVHVGSYVLMYLKNNTIRKVEGSHILI
jgi:hypothetical protein